MKLLEMQGLGLLLGKSGGDLKKYVVVINGARGHGKRKMRPSDDSERMGMPSSIYSARLMVYGWMYGTVSL